MQKGMDFSSQCRLSANHQPYRTSNLLQGSTSSRRHAITQLSQSCLSNLPTDWVGCWWLISTIFGKLTCNRLEDFHSQYEMPIFPSGSGFSQRIRPVTRTYWNCKYLLMPEATKKQKNIKAPRTRLKILYRTGKKYC